MSGLGDIGTVKRSESFYNICMINKVTLDKAIALNLLNQMRMHMDLKSM